MEIKHISRLIFNKIFEVILIVTVLSGFGSSKEVLGAGSNFLETVGVSTAVGTVLGASTLPFYESPGSHFANVGIGLGAGALTGLGIWTYDRFFSNNEGAREGAVLTPIEGSPQAQNVRTEEILGSFYQSLKKPDRAIGFPFNR